MTVITEAELREMWQGGRGFIPPLPGDARFTPSARDFIKQWGITVTFIDDFEHSSSKPGEGPNWKDGRMEAGADKISQPPIFQSSNSPPPIWDKPVQFPVNLTGPLPVCTVCGQPVTKKPANLAQLNATHFAPKTSPRFVFRGKMDTLHAQFLLAAAQARRFNLPDLLNHLSTLAAYCREITSAEYNEREVSPLQLAGLTEAEIREASHWPDRVLGIAHMVPGLDDHELLLQLNLLRCQTRETELVAASAFTGSDGRPTRPDLIVALNRLSSAVYFLMLLLKAGKIAWKLPGGLG